MSKNTDIPNNISFLENIFSKDEIVTHSSKLDEELKNCIDIKKEILCIVKPKNKEQIVELLKNCQKNNIDIYVYST